MASSAAAMPSAIEWCSFSIKAIWPFASPSTKVSSHKGRPGVRGAETTSAKSSKSSVSVPGADNRRFVTWLVMSKVGSSHQTGGASTKVPGRAI